MLAWEIIMNWIGLNGVAINYMIYYDNIGSVGLPLFWILQIKLKDVIA